MNAVRWQLVREAFHSLCALDHDRRRDELRRRYGHDPDLVAEVESLLSESDAADRDGFFIFGDSTRAETNTEVSDDFLPKGMRIGPYAVERVLGRGGMSDVYLAFRRKPYEQRVALKIIRAPMTPSKVRRLEVERQLLSRLIHPHVVRLLDGGSAEGGMPYLAMELIDGIPIDSYCDRDHLTVVARARLLHIVAQAIAYAHDLGIVHRDLKPSNILVSNDGTPKVIDLGLARPFRNEQVTSMTGRGAIPGTPGYIAPERLGGQSRSLPEVDCYGLGAILYRLLTGRPPFEGETPLQTCLLAVDGDPVPPRKLNRSIPRDLDTIIRKALAREPSDRFATAGEMAEQLGHFLAGRPLTIRPPTPWPLVGKWANRHRTGLLTWGVSILLLLAVMTGLLAARNRTLWETEQTLTELISHVSRTNEDLIQGIPPGADRTHSYHETMVAFFDAALDREGNDAGPKLRRSTALMHHNLARSYAARNEAGDAELHFSRAIELLRPLSDETRGRPEHPWLCFDLLRCYQGRAFARCVLGDRPEALADGREALRVVSELSDDEPENVDWLAATAKAHNDLARLLMKASALLEAKEHAHRSLELSKRVCRMVPDEPRYLLQLHGAHWILASIYEAAERLSEAEVEYRALNKVADAYLRRSSSGWEAKSVTIDARGALAAFLSRGSPTSESERLLREAIELSTNLIESFPDQVGYVQRDANLWRALGDLQLARGHAMEAEQSYRTAVARLEDILDRGPDQHDTLDLLLELYESCPVESVRNPRRAHVLRSRAQPGKG